MNHYFARLFILCILLGFSCGEERYSDPLGPEEALKSFHLREGFKIELFASEPQVIDPVEMAFDEQGNVFVVEMPDYPFEPEGDKGSGKIKVLQDTDSDGRIDHTVIFADSLLEATSILPWEGGLLVAAAPYILFLKDTNGDLVSDSREILFSGFYDKNSELQITSLRFAVDNWIYAANNGQAGEVTFSRKPDAPALSTNGGDFRFRLDRGQFELETGVAQFGHSIDDWGNRFTTQNTLHIRHAAIPWRYLHRNPHLPRSTSLINISDHDLEMFQLTPAPYWRAERTRRRQKQFDEENLDRVEYAEDAFTGCSGALMYDGHAFPTEYYGNVFTGDVAGNLVHRDVLKLLDTVPTFVASRDSGEKTREFLASTDPWFRPVSLSVGPDGYLYIVDMYRQHIEGPAFIPEDLKTDMEFYNGSDRGRIYRIVPENADEKNKAIPKMKRLPTAEYVQLLTHPNRWWRLQAQRLLLGRKDLSIVPQLENLFSGHSDPRVRLHALYVLEGLDALRASLVSQAMKDPHPGVRRHGVMLAERYPELLPELLERTNDSSVHVVFQATLSVGQFADKKALDVLANVLTIHGEDPLFRAAVLSARATSAALLDELITQHGFSTVAEPWKATFIEDLAYMTGSANQPAEVNHFLDLLSSPSIEKESPWPLAGITGLKKGLQRSWGEDASRKQMLEGIQASDTSQVRDAIRELRKVVANKKVVP